MKQTAALANAPVAAKVVMVPDSAAAVGNQHQIMRTGAQILCLNPDGSQSYYTVDAERSRPGALVLLRTKP